MSRATDYDRVQNDWMTEEDLQHWFPVAEPVAGELEWCDGCHRRVVNTSGLPPDGNLIATDRLFRVVPATDITRSPSRVLGQVV